ncbi:MAG: glycoside hydrolase family 3 N-terminal domain-containing protein [Pseudomonadota bacterium]
MSAGEREAGRAAVVAALMARMTLAEKIGQLALFSAGEGPATGEAGGPPLAELIAAGRVGSVFGTKSFDTVKRLQDEALKSRLAIPLLFAEDVIHGHRTLMPLPLGLAASFDMALVEETAAAAAREASAEGIHQAYAPMLDICRDARWGRVAESPGEDPFLAARYAEAMVRGFQGDDLADPERLSACLKHFIGYGAAVGGRDYDAAEIALHTLYDVYAEPFRAGVAAGATAVMTGFNTLNGIPMHAHPLVKDWLRGAAGFEGVVVSDYTGLREVTAHGLGGQEARAVRALLAGIDLDMISGDYLAALPETAEKGLEAPESGLSVSANAILAAIDAAVERILTLKDRLGLFEDPLRGATAERAAAAPLRPETRALGRRAAAAAAVLLKNDGLLPLREDGLRIALIGPLGDDRPNMLGTWAVSGDPHASVTIREGLAAADNEIRFAPGAPVVDEAAVIDRLNFVPETVTPDPRPPAVLLAEAEALAAWADVIVAVVGEAKEHTGECASRAEPDIPAPQRRLLARLALSGKPMAAVVLAGRPLVLGELPETANALVYAFFGGTEMGNGLADLLYGRAEPTARLPVSLPAHAGQAPLHHGAHEGGRPWPGEWRKFTTNYIDLPDDQHPGRGRYPFGAGLAYTRFAFAAPVLAEAQLAGAEAVADVSVAVENIGARAGTAVVQLYVSDPVARIARPAQELKGIARLILAPGERGTARFKLTRDDLSYTLPDAAGRPERVWDPGEFVIRTGPDAANTEAASLRWDP